MNKVLFHKVRELFVLKTYRGFNTMFTLTEIKKLLGIKKSFSLLKNVAFLIDYNALEKFFHYNTTEKVHMHCPNHQIEYHQDGGVTRTDIFF